MMKTDLFIDLREQMKTNEMTYNDSIDLIKSILNLSLDYVAMYNGSFNKPSRCLMKRHFIETLSAELEIEQIEADIQGEDIIQKAKDKINEH